MDAVEFVKKVAEESPIIPDGEINVCKFCHTSWAEDTYDEYLRNVAILKENPMARKGTGLGTRIAFDHHDDDCLWVIANQIVMEL